MTTTTETTTPQPSTAETTTTANVGVYFMTEEFEVSFKEYKHPTGVAWWSCTDRGAAWVLIYDRRTLTSFIESFELIAN